MWTGKISHVQALYYFDLKLSNVLIFIVANQQMAEFQATWDYF